jgi:lysozyme
MKLLLKLLFLSLLTSACGEALDKKNVTGIDVSHFQGEINWALIKKSGYSFTYIKVSEGETLTDSKLVENWEGANQAAILQGGYHVFTPGDTGELQAENFINSLKAVQRDYQGFLPPVLDIEAISKGKLIYA